MRILRVFTAILITIFVLTLLAGCVSPAGQTGATTTKTITVTATSNTPASNSSTTASPYVLPISFADIVSNAMPSVVFIQQSTVDSNGSTVTVSGSGIILRSDGYILTNRHVVENARTLTVMLDDLKTYYSSQFWLDDTLDLAVIKIDASNLPTIPWANPALTKVGDWVIAIGFPLGQSPTGGGATVTNGIVGNLGRSFFINYIPYWDVIQTDAAINPGNSGGPLINLNGELVGINTASSTQGQGINFAINIASAHHVFDDLVAYGAPHHPYLGVSLGDASTFISGVSYIGTLVNFVDSGGPADAAGLLANDLIIGFDNQNVNFTSDLIRALWRHQVGDSVAVTLIRGQSKVNITIVLGQRPASGLQQVQPLNSPSARF